MKKIFGFTSAQRIGIIFWSGIILFFLVISNHSFSKTKKSLVEINSSDIEFLELGIANQYSSDENEIDDFKKNQQSNYFNFDPNTITKTEWKQLGFSDKQADAIILYRTNTGGFKKKTDLKKVFVISESKYNELEPYIEITDITNEKSALKKININIALDDELQALPGIGPKLAERILKYRKSLGGFTSLTQLHEIYGITEELYQIIIEQFNVETEGISQIKINSATKDEIDKHPYITWPMTASILKKREQEKILSLDFLIESKIASEEEILKIKPYINFE